MFKLFDDRRREHLFARAPMRVVSLVPSDTYSLCALGVSGRLVGRTRYCVEPAAELSGVPQLGGPKDPEVDRIIALRPDLVLANQEENSPAPLGALFAAGIPVFVSYPRTVADGIAHLARLARVLQVAAAPAVRSLIRAGYELGCAERDKEPLVPAFVPVWLDPLMTMNGDTFGSDALELAGARNVFADRVRRYPLAADLGQAEPLPPSAVGDRDLCYPRVTLSEVQQRQPELVLLPDEPHEFSEQDADVVRGLDIPAARQERGVRFCSGKDLFWYGAWSVQGIPRLRALVQSAR